jgi:hypothetical protein
MNFLYLDEELQDGYVYELPSGDDVTDIEVSKLLDMLTELEAEAVDILMQGRRLRRKVHIDALDRIRRKYITFYGEVG